MLWPLAPWVVMRMCAMLMMVITKLIRVIRNQLRSAESPPPVYTEQQLVTAIIPVIASIPEQITQCQAQGWHHIIPMMGGHRSIKLPLTTHDGVFVLFVFLSVWPSISSPLARAVLWIFYLAQRWVCSVFWWPLIRLNRSSKTNHTIKK